MPHHHHHDCTCGHDHSHTHSHDHDCDCGCGHDHSHHHHETVTLTTEEVNYLRILSETKELPVTRFLMRSSNSEHIESVALAPVHLMSEADSMNTVKLRASALTKLEEYGLVDLDYDTPILLCDYGMHERSELYAFFVKTLEEGKANPDFVFDVPALEKGKSMLSEMGVEVAKKLVG